MKFLKKKKKLFILKEDRKRGKSTEGENRQQIININTIISLIPLNVNRIKDIDRINKNLMESSVYMGWTPWFVGFITKWNGCRSLLFSWVLIFLGKNHLSSILEVEC